MLISKFDLYKPEWLELVFDNRNKEYGAYNLRQDYGQNMTRAMGFTFSGLILLGGLAFAFKSTPVAEPKPTVDVIKVVISPPPVQAIKREHPPIPPKSSKPDVAQAKVTTTRFVTMVPVPDPIAQKPTKNEDIKGEVGPVTIKGPGTVPDLPTDKPSSGGGTPDVSIHEAYGLDVMPQPVGGDAAWAKFLNRNLRFPATAQDDQVSGRVYISFIIEKDGSLTDITVLKGAGHGFDDEALRVLKLAKAWKPGMQNGQPVRVKYTIPINFQFTDNN